MEKTDMLIIGGSVLGIVNAVTGKASYPDKEFVAIRREKQAVVPRGTPYIFGSSKSSDEDVISDTTLAKIGVRLKIDEVVSLDKDKKHVKLPVVQISPLENFFLSTFNSFEVIKYPI